jgi:hypothetical protein|tara:strand:- start:8619 stop:9377 length:759 start_codon:yes stop_codon:yes gene_type:complete
MESKNNLIYVSSYTPTFQENTLSSSPDKSLNLLNNNEPNNIKNLNYSTVPPTQSYYKPIKSNETSYIPVSQNYGNPYNYGSTYVPNYYTPSYETPHNVVMSNLQRPYNSNIDSFINYIYPNINCINVIKNYLENLMLSKEVISDLLKNIKPVELESLFMSNFIMYFSNDQTIFVNKIMDIIEINNLINLLNKNDYLNLTFNNKILIDKILLKINEKYKYNLNSYESVKLFLNEYLKDLELHNLNKRMFYLFL